MAGVSITCHIVIFIVTKGFGSGVSIPSSIYTVDYLWSKRCVLRQFFSSESALVRHQYVYGSHTKSWYTHMSLTTYLRDFKAMGAIFKPCSR
jgi:hypothetical protein